MKQAIEVAHLVKGQVVSVRRLSKRAERRAASAAFAAVLALTTAAAVGLGGVLEGASRVVHAPSYIALWGGLGLALALVAGGKARARARRYAIGVDIDDDAYAPFPHALVQRAAGDYELKLAPGMMGMLETMSQVETGQRSQSIEALVREGNARVRLGEGMRAEVTMAATTFAVRALSDDGATAPLPRGFWRPFVRRAMLPVQVAALLTFVRAVPAGAPLAETDMRSAIPADATPWEVEKLLREEAQRQARTLHACFDTLPMTCQHPGYVGVGLSLSREGEIRGSWIARSTYGQECPVDACMSQVIAGWFFEALPESMRIVLPVQVLRTDKPLPAHAATGASPTRVAEASPFRNVAP